jgi:hypothetical protein
MASLQAIEHFLQIKTAGKYLNPGRKDPEMNQQYRYPNYLIVSMADDKWFIVDTRRYSDDILSKHIFCNMNGYPNTNIQLDGRRSHKYFHQILINYTSDLVCDHVNRNPFDNRLENLRIVTQQENTRNQSMRCSNTSGMNGICERFIKKFGFSYFIVQITNNNNKRIQKAFNIDKLGRDEALRCAIEHRKKWVKEFGYLHE